MKLKRTVQGKIAILQVSESYNQQDLAVLRAGVNQMTTGKGDKLIIVDVTTATPSTPSLAAELHSLPGLAAENEAALLVAGPSHAELGGATVEDAKRKLISPEFKAGLEELFLNARANKLERRKKELEEKTRDSDKKLAELIEAQRQNSKLARSHRSLLKQVQTLLSEVEQLQAPKGNPGTTQATREQTTSIHQSIRSVLDQIGIAKP